MSVRIEKSTLTTGELLIHGLTDTSWVSHVVREDRLPALRDAIDAYLIPPSKDEPRATQEQFRIDPASQTPTMSPDKDPLPEPSLRNEIDELRQRIARLEELIAIV